MSNNYEIIPKIRLTAAASTLKQRLKESRATPAADADVKLTFAKPLLLETSPSQNLN